MSITHARTRPLFGRFAPRLSVTALICGLLVGMSAMTTAADAAVSRFTVQLNRVGSVTAPQVYVTTRQYHNISIRLVNNPHAAYVKAVRCDERGDISTAKHFAADWHGVQAIAVGVRDHTCFKLNFDAPTLRTFLVEGNVSY